MSYTNLNKYKSYLGEILSEDLLKDYNFVKDEHRLRVIELWADDDEIARIATTALSIGNTVLKDGSTEFVDGNYQLIKLVLALIYFTSSRKLLFIHNNNNRDDYTDGLESIKESSYVCYVAGLKNLYHLGLDNSFFASTYLRLRPRYEISDALASYDDSDMGEIWLDIIEQNEFHCLSILAPLQGFIEDAGRHRLKMDIEKVAYAYAILSRVASDLMRYSPVSELNSDSNNVCRYFAISELKIAYWDFLGFFRQGLERQGLFRPVLKEQYNLFVEIFKSETRRIRAEKENHNEASSYPEGEVSTNVEEGENCEIDENCENCEEGYDASEDINDHDHMIENAIDCIMDELSVLEDELHAYNEPYTGQTCYNNCANDRDFGEQEQEIEDGDEGTQDGEENGQNCQDSAGDGENGQNGQDSDGDGDELTDQGAGEDGANGANGANGAIETAEDNESLEDGESAEDTEEEASELSDPFNEEEQLALEAEDSPDSLLEKSLEQTKVEKSRDVADDGSDIDSEKAKALIDYIKEETPQKKQIPVLPVLRPPPTLLRKENLLPVLKSPNMNSYMPNLTPANTNNQTLSTGTETENIPKPKPLIVTRLVTPPSLNGPIHSLPVKTEQEKAKEEEEYGQELKDGIFPKKAEIIPLPAKVEVRPKLPLLIKPKSKLNNI
jgi:hypothetical protein